MRLPSLPPFPLQIQRHIGESYAEYMAGKTYLYQTAANLDLDKAGNRLDTDGVKLFCTTMAKNVADRAIQVGAGRGIGAGGQRGQDCTRTLSLNTMRRQPDKRVGL
jgi:hypothetical protein